MSHWHFGLPSTTDDELITLPGAKPRTAVRICVQPGQDALVRLEQLAYSATIGWYTQKSFCIPAEMLDSVIPQLRKAQCLLPERSRRKLDGDPIRFPPPPLPSSTRRPAGNE